MSKQVLKTITHCYYEDQQKLAYTQTVVGVFDSLELPNGLDVLKKEMANRDFKLVRDEKDCCNYYLEFLKSDAKGDSLVEKEWFYTGDYIINELQMK